MPVGLPMAGVGWAGTMECEAVKFEAAVVGSRSANTGEWGWWAVET